MINVINIPKVSVVIPTFNRASLIKEAIDSVISQTFKDFEIIIIDDGSTDDTREVIRKYGNKINYYYQDNKGPGAARNLGVNKAKGEYIAFIDSDDIWLPKKLEVQVPFLDKDPNLAFVCSDTYVVNHKGDLIKIWTKENGVKESFESLRKGNYITTLTVLIRKTCFNAVEGFDERLCNAQDYDLWLRLTKKGYRFIFIDQALGKCRFHDSNNTKNTDGRVRSYSLLLKKKELWRSMSYWQRRKRFSQMFYHFAQAYLADRRYAKASFYYLKSVMHNPFSGCHFYADKNKVSIIYKFLRVYYLIFKCGIKSILSRKEKKIAA